MKCDGLYVVRRKSDVLVYAGTSIMGFDKPRQRTWSARPEDAGRESSGREAWHEARMRQRTEEAQAVAVQAEFAELDRLRRYFIPDRTLGYTRLLVDAIDDHVEQITGDRTRLHARSCSVGNLRQCSAMRFGCSAPVFSVRVSHHRCGPGQEASRCPALPMRSTSPAGTGVTSS